MSNTYYDLPSNFRERLSDEFYRAIAQEDQKFAGVGMVRSDWIQTQQSFRVMAPIELTETTGQRGGDTQQGEVLTGYRSGFIRDFEGAINFDINDKDRLYTADRPDGEVMQNFRAAWNRRMDDIIIDAAQEYTYGGLKPYNTVQTPLPALMEIPVTWDKISNGATNTNFTIWKVTEAIKRMKKQNVDLDREMATIAIPPDVEQAWLQYAMSAPNTPFALAFMKWWDGKAGAVPAKFWGCDLIVSNRLKYVGSVYTCLVFCKSAFWLSPANFDLRIAQLPERRFATTIAVFCKRGAMRMWDEKVNLCYSDLNVAITY